MARTSKPAEVGPWAKEKLGALGQYLDYYTKVLKNQPRRLVYIDAFAGGGTAAVRIPKRVDETQFPLIDDSEDLDEQEFIRGSPRIALELDNPFSTYVFIDASGARITELEALKVEFTDTRNVHIRPGLADDQIKWVLQQNIRKSSHRGVAFLDPFGAHLSWSSIQGLADTGLFEILVNFPLHMALVRLMKNDAQIAAADRDQLNRFFGSGDWEHDVYERRSDLLETVVCKRPDYIERLLERYRAQLRRAFGHVSEPKLIRNTKNSPLYCLLWAGPHRKGLQGANYILGIGERLASGPRGGRPPKGS